MSLWKVTAQMLNDALCLLWRCVYLAVAEQIICSDGRMREKCIMSDKFYLMYFSPHPRSRTSKVEKYFSFAGWNFKCISRGCRVWNMSMSALDGLGNCVIMALSELKGWGFEGWVSAYFVCTSERQISTLLFARRIKSCYVNRLVFDHHSVLI